MKIRFILFIASLFSALSSYSQTIVDPCYTSVNYGTSFPGNSDIYSMNADLVHWTGSSWLGQWSNANVTMPPPQNQSGCRAVWIGNASSWTSGGEGFALRLDQPLVAGQTYSFPFTYVSHGFGSTGSFSLRFSTYSSQNYPSSYYVGNLPAVGTTWTTNTITFTATSSQGGHNWIFLHNGTSGTSGLVNSLCPTCNASPTCAISIGSDLTLCQGQTSVLNATTAGATYLWQDGSTGSTYSVSQPGTYWVKVSAGSCIAYDTISVAYNPLPLVNLGNDTTLCQGADLTLNPNVSGASYVWQNSSTGQTFTVNSSGTYWVDATLNSCTARDSIIVSFIPMPAVQFGNDTILCNQDSLLLNAYNPNATYLWNDNSTDTTFNVQQAGVYWVTVTSGNCIQSDTISISYNQSPVVDLGPDTSLCSGSSIVLDPGYPSAQLMWHDNSTQPQYTVNSSGTYAVEVYLNGCSGFDTVQVNYIVLPPGDLGSDTVLCNGSTLLLDAGPGFTSYLWHDNSQSQTFLATQSGFYWIEATYQNCISRDTIQVTLDYVVALGSDTTLCEGQNLVLDPGVQGASYTWQDMSTSQTYAVSASGTYYVTGVLNACTSSDTIQVQFNPLPVIDLGSDTVICSGNTMMLDATLPGATYLWQDLSTGPMFSTNQTGSYSVEVIAGGCQNSDTINLNFPQIILDLGRDTILCTGDTLVINALNQNATYLWQDNSTSSSMSVFQQGLYYVEVNVDGCVEHDSINVSFNQKPQVFLGNDTVLCSGQSMILNAFVPGSTYLWQDNSTLPSYSVSMAGTYSVAVSLNNCTENDTITVQFDVAPDIDLGNDTILCQGQTLTLVAGTSGTTFVWQDNSVTPVYSVNSPGIYFVQNTTATCESRDTILVTYMPLPNVALGNDTTLCDGQQLTLDATYFNAIYQWQDNSDDAVMQVATPGTYWVVVTSGGCASRDSVIVTYSNTGIKLGNDTTYCSLENVKLFSGNPNGSVLWSTGSTLHEIPVTSPGTYWIKVTSGGCISTDTIDVELKDCQVEIVMPNVFSPNGDNRNDHFKPVKLQNVVVHELIIFNRWGQKVFTSDEQDFSWDGKEGSRECPDGTYFWMLRYSADLGSDVNIQGTVSLMR